MMAYPRGAIVILVSYLLERLVYYGLFGGAVFYMQRMLGFTSSSATTVTAIMEGLVNLAPIAGAVVADVYLGKARTVFLMCCGCTVGAAIFTLSSVTPIMASFSAAKFTAILGMLVMGVCTGLMKAAYTSLGADQFKVPEQREQQKRFFNAFYWMVNAGTFVGLFITAQIRDSVQCFGDDCYFLSYIIMAGLMVVSTVIFAAGRSHYKEGLPDKMMIRAVRCVAYAVTKTWDKDREPVQHWLDRAQDKFDAQLLLDVKVTLRVLLLFCTFPLFNTLYYHTSTGMIFQAKRLDGMVGSYRIPPEMSYTANPLLVLALIPLFDFVVYPLLARVGVPQYVLITIGDVLFTVSGMDFAYSQAPMAMKSSLQAANLFTITVGLWLFAGLTSLSSATGAFKHRPSHEAFFYACLMSVNTIIFIVLIRRNKKSRLRTPVWRHTQVNPVCEPINN